GEAAEALASTPDGLIQLRLISETRTRAWDLLLEARSACGEDEDLIPDLEATVAADPFAERGWEMLMTALYRSGRQAAALGAFQRARAVLIDGAGLEPGPALRELEQRIIEQDRSLLSWSATATANNEPGAGTASVPQPPSWVDSTAGSEAEQESHSVAADLSWFQTPTKLAGRRSELEAIDAAIAYSRTENLPQVIMLGGDAGMGKTRLAGEAAQAASDAGIRVLYGACDPSISSAHRPISMAIERHLARDPGAFDHLPQSTLALLATISPALEDRVGPAGQHELSDADDDHRIIVSIGAWLASIADGQGLLLVLDDLHWAPASTVALVTHLANNPIPIPLTVIATYRPRDLTDRSALTTALPTLLRHPRCRSIQLGRLSYQEMHDLVEQSAGHDVPEELTGHIERVTGGNPYLVVSTLRHITNSELAVRRNQRWELRPGALWRAFHPTTPSMPSKPRLSMGWSSRTASTVGVGNMTLPATSSWTRSQPPDGFRPTGGWPKPYPRMTEPIFMTLPTTPPKASSPPTPSTPRST
ncbi:MAG: BTAD domain-containing putative transcriptional regulator, partial [Acidimicrobiales bacterium]